MSDKLSVIKNILGKPHPEGQELLFHCPYCSHHKKKLSLNLDRDVFKCWICNVKGRTRRIIRRFGTFLQLQKWDDLVQTPDVIRFKEVFFAEKEQEDKRSLSLPEGFETLVTSWPNMNHPAHQYLMSRGLTQQDINRWKIGYVDSGFWGGRIIVPSFDDSGELNYFVGRSYENHQRKYMAPKIDKNVIFNELYVEWDEDVILVEGVFDAFKAYNAVPILGSTMSENSRLLKKIVENDSPIFVALDWDAEKKARRLMRLLMEYGVELYKINTRSIEDVGAITKEQFLELKKTASLINPDTYILYEMKNFI